MNEKRIKKVYRIILCSIMMLVFICGCSAEEATTSKENIGENEATINIAFQYGLAYAPLVVAQQQELIEKEYNQITGKQVNVTWNQMSSGADINTAFLSGDINVGFMGVAPAITGISNHVGYKIFTNLSGQEHGLMTNDAQIHRLSDLVDSNKQIALVNLGSIQHIILAKALVHAGYDAHALDSNLIAMKHPDGLTSLESGNLACHLTTNPYLYKEMEKENLYEVDGISDVWSSEDSFIVGIASENVKQDEELYLALCNAIEDAIDFINTYPQDASAITYELDGNSKEEEEIYLTKGYYSTETKGIMDLAAFMFENDFIDSELKDYNELVFDNVKGN